MRRTFFIILAAALAFGITSVGANAAPITTFSSTTFSVTGSGGTGGPAPPFTNATSLTFGALTIGSVGLPNTLLGANALTNGTLTVTTVGAPAGFVIGAPTTFSFAVATGGVTIGTFGTTNAGGIVQFQLINPLEVFAGPTTTIGSMGDGTPELKLISNTSGLDFGPINGLFHLQIAATGVIFNSTNGTFSAPGTTAGAFTASAVTPAAIPEPGAFAIWGVVCSGACFVAYRRRKQVA